MNEVIYTNNLDNPTHIVIGAPEGAELHRYARLQPLDIGFVISDIVESHLDPDETQSEWVLCGNAGPGWTTTDKSTFSPPAGPIYSECTKRAFQNRFPLAANGISTKWDVLCLFLSDDGYASSLGVTGAPLYALRLLITTGQQRLNASPFVSMVPGGEADEFTQLLLDAGIPAAFRITAAERTKMLTNPLQPEERYKV